MPARDIYHAVVRNALIKDGWTITHDPYTLTFGPTDVYVDLSAEQPIGAERQGEQIAVEIKSFVGASDVRDFEVALGQYVFYRSLLARWDSSRRLFLAVREEVYIGFLHQVAAKLVLEDLRVSIVVFKAAPEVILKWIP
jgi:hypothetical protein